MSVINTGTRLLIVRHSPTVPDSLELTLRNFDLLYLTDENSVIRRMPSLQSEAAQFSVNLNDAMILSDMLGMHADQLRSGRNRA